jgi:hypothetical protein
MHGIVMNTLNYNEGMKICGEDMNNCNDGMNNWYLNFFLLKWTIYEQVFKGISTQKSNP